MRTIYSCGIKINPIPADEVCAIADQWLKDGRKGFQITGINLEQIALLNRDKDFECYINSSDIVNIDGIAVSAYLKLKLYRKIERTLCADILHKMLENANLRKERVFLLGAKENTIKHLAENIHSDYPDINIVGFHSGYFTDEKEIVLEIAKSNPDYLFIGMPSPFKERFITTYKDQLNAGICFGVGGMFDIMAGEVKRAPVKIQKLGLERFYRVSQDPSGQIKRLRKAIPSCLLVYIKHLLERRKEVI